MKKILYIICISLGVMWSCVDDVKDTFDSSAAERVAQQATEYEAILTAAPNGWEMAYYPQSDQTYGGYTFFMKFNSTGSFVDIMSQVGDQATTTIEQSNYSVIAYRGVVLSFNTYNSLFHYFSDPNPNITGLPAGSGYEGDFEFMIVEASAEKVVLKGLKTDNYLTMTPIPAGEAWESRMARVITVMDDVDAGIYPQFLLSAGGGDPIVFTAGVYNVFTYLPPTETDPINTTNMAFRYTPTGIQLYEPLELLGRTTQNFDWDVAAQKYVSTDPGATDVELVAHYPEEFVHYNDYLGTYTVAYETNTGAPATTTMSLIENVPLKSFWLTGFGTASNPLRINVTYDRSLMGGLSAVVQLIGYDTDGTPIHYYVSQGRTSLNWTVGAGLNALGERNQAGQLVIKWTDNGVLGDGVGLIIINTAGGYYLYGSPAIVIKPVMTKQ